MTTTIEIDVAPSGFSVQAWEQFSRDGLLVVEDALSEDDVATLRSAIEDQSADSNWNIVESDERFADLIDHPAHIGYIYDTFGDSSKLVRSEYFRRPPGQEIRNKWHYDGPRVVPFDVFSKNLPIRIKVGFWLTPLTSPGMGNLTYIPGSHHTPSIPELHTHRANPSEKSLLVRPGAMTLMWGGLWHRVAENRSATTRLNLFLEYAPSWVVSSDRIASDPEWVAGLSRAQRILIRNYDEPNHLVKLPDTDVPLFAPRTGQSDSEAIEYADEVPISLRKRRTWLEQQGLV